MISFDKKTMDEFSRIQKKLEEHPEIAEKFKQEHPELSCEYTVKCPTCGCPNVHRISSTEKLGNAMAFGFFGNKRKQQFECMNPNCRYRW